MVDDKSFPLQKDVQAFNTVPAPGFSEFAHTCSKNLILIFGDRSPDSTSIDRQHTTGPPLRAAVPFLNEMHSIFSDRWLQKFFPMTSLSITMSSACTATSL